MNVLKETPIPPISRVVSAVSMSHHYIYAPIPLPTIPTSLFQNSSFGAADAPDRQMTRHEFEAGAQRRRIEKSNINGGAL
jgi:hypothetical protein